MSASRYKSPKTQPRYDGSEVFVNLTPGAIAAAQTYPGVARRNERALDGEWVNCSYFQALASGRRCSCWGADTTPKAACKVCYQTGIVGGWQKHGTKQWILDTTLPNVTMVNVRPHVGGEGPTVFVLEDEATYGEIQATGDFEGCWGDVDVLDAVDWTAEDGVFEYWIKTTAATGWVSLNTTNLQNLFSTPQRFDVKVILRRPSVNATSPQLQRLLLRIHRTPTDNTLIKTNRPRGTRALAFADIGVLDEWASERWWTDGNKLTNIGSQDWFYDRDNKVRWKVTETDKFAPQTYLLSWDLTVRKVYDYEPAQNFPV